MSARRSRPRRGRPRARRGVDRVRWLPVVIIAASVVFVLLVGLAIVKFIELPSGTPRTGPLAARCEAKQPIEVGRISVPAGPVAGYCQPQLQNAAEIIRAAKALGIGRRGQQIGVMTAIGESGLRNLTYGDRVGPDSRGLFQQRANWGPLAARMDPYTAATAFFRRMVGVERWNTRPATEVAHLVQGNADPEYYTKFEVRAGLLVNDLDTRIDTWPWE